MTDPSLTHAERLINSTNLSALNNILTNIRLRMVVFIVTLAQAECQCGL
jgi:hypothetical protein